MCAVSASGACRLAATCTSVKIFADSLSRSAFGEGRSASSAESRDSLMLLRHLCLLLAPCVQTDGSGKLMSPCIAQGSRGACLEAGPGMGAVLCLQAGCKPVRLAMGERFAMGEGLSSAGPPSGQLPHYWGAASWHSCVCGLL